MRWKCFTFKLLFCWSLINAVISSASVFKWKSDPNHEDVTSSVDRIRMIADISKLQCSRECLGTTGCVAFFYNRHLQTCHLQSSIKLDPAYTHLSNGTKFYVNVCMKYNYKYNADLRKYFHCHTKGLSTQSGAALTCNNIGGRLISLDDEREFHAMQQILKHLPNNPTSQEAFWVGAQVNRITGKFEWENGVKVKHGFWAKDQPAYDGNKTVTECVLMVPIFDYKLDDFNCSLSASFIVFPICECALV